MHSPSIRNPILVATLLAALSVGLLAVVSLADTRANIDFDRDVRPILAENCFKCHGPDAGARQAGLRLDIAEGATTRLVSGRIPVVPGNLAKSELVLRIGAKDARQMPPVSSGKKLKSAQIAILREWIQQGARYGKHWAFIAPIRPALPSVKNTTWPRNQIDYFILAHLEKEGLKPSPEADKRTLIRRVCLDLTGLPPTIAEVDAFLADKSPNAYEKVVDRLLASPHYGERMALPWLDLAHYADTHGYHIDSHRDMWKWRDWVINAFNRNLNYDQFVVEQLAGDLLPNATLDQKVATGFCRNHPINFEGGAIPEEYAAAYVEDRIDTTATTFMALTLRCTQCHDHKYDPFTQREYYRYYAFFNNIPENGLDGQKGNAAPFIKVPTPEQQGRLDGYRVKIADLEKSQKARYSKTASAQADWEKVKLAAVNSPVVPDGLALQIPLDETTGDQVHDAAGKVVGKLSGKPDWTAGQLSGAVKLDGMTFADLGGAFAFDRNDKVSYGAWVYPTSNEALTVISRMDDADANRGWDIYLGSGKVFAHIISKWEQNAIRVNTKNAIEMNKWHHIFVTFDGSSKAKGVRIYLDGKAAELDVTHDSLSDTIKTNAPLLIGRRNPAAPFKGMIDDVRIYSRELSPSEVAQIAEDGSIRPLLTIAADKRTSQQAELLTKYYLEHNDDAYRKITADLSDQRKQFADLDASIPTTMVMEEMPKKRETHILLRGAYDKKGDVVTCGTPEVLPPLPKDAPANRLGFARWLVDPSHPLTARVAVNRFWQMYFGTGLVKTAENFGIQGERPSHPELLDWLATEFMGGNGAMEYASIGQPNTQTLQHPNTPTRRWDIKALQRLIVTSATYRQSSRATPEGTRKDPENRLLSHAPRFRMTAEFVRDQALAVSGLLVPKIGGPSVKPYHPAGLWEEMAFGGEFTAQKYVQDHGEDLYRRSMYTFWKRTVPPPDMLTFDAPEREFCIVRRSVTNTPLQALILWNNPIFVEASRKFAERILIEPPMYERDRLSFAFQAALGRPATDKEHAVLLKILHDQMKRFDRDQAGAVKLLSVGESKRNEKLNAAELAAWTTVASMILNLDETLTKG